VNKISMDMNNFSNEFAENEKRHKKKYKENVALRRNLVRSMLIKGSTQWEIAESLDISQSTVCRDIQWLRSVAKKELEDMLEKNLPEEYHKYLGSIEEVLRHAWKIAHSGFTEKTRLEALQFVIECSKHKMDVIMNPPVLTKSNNSLKPFKGNSHFQAVSTTDSHNSFTTNQKEIKKSLPEK
jgi:transposase